MIINQMGTIKFQLTPSRRATGFPNVHGCYEAFQLTPSRRATIHYRRFDHINIISTHALTEGDEDLDTILPPCIAISTHALTEGDINSADTFFK